MVQLNLQQYFDLAVQHHQAGRLEQAKEIYGQILARHPAHSPSLHLLGVLASQSGRKDIAIQMVRASLELDPMNPAAHNNLALILREVGRNDEAIASLRQAVALNPNYVEAWVDLGNALSDKSETDEAIDCYHKAIAINPNYPLAHNNLANAVAAKGLLDEAIAGYTRAISLDPKYAVAFNNLGNAMNKKGQLPKAIEYLQKAISIDASMPGFHHNLGNALLVSGQFTQGWQEYEWRLKIREFSLPRTDMQPRWDGSPLNGRTILLHPEQGFGDTIHFIRYLPMVREMGGKVIIECQPQLERLLQPMAGESPVVTTGSPLPHFDVYCPLLSLPLMFKTTLDSIPSPVPYIRADAIEIEKWRERLTKYPATKKVGLVWAGSPQNQNDANRSIPFARFKAITQTPGTQFFSLQKESKPSTDLQLVDLMLDAKDFADTAALIANLDLVISVDTSVAHLAGAMGKPVWTLLPLSPDWRWMLDRTDSPWYPTMRLFRQPTIGDWESVLNAVADALTTHS